jgi:transposase
MGIHKRAGAIEAENLQLKKENAHLKAEIERLTLLNERFIAQIRLAQHRRFGTSSEGSIFSEQMGLFNEAEDSANITILEPELEEVTYKRRKQKGIREELYKNIPTEQIIHDIPESERVCPVCGGVLHACGHEVLRREVEIIPAHVRGIEHVQTVYGCRSCEKSADVEAPPMIKAVVPAPVIPNSGIASPSLLSYTICNKYVLGLPLYRQEQELKRLGVPISRQTLANWMIHVAENRLAPLYALLHTLFLLNNVAHADETTTQVIFEDGRSASQKSYMWVYTTGRDTPQQIILFDYQQTREGKHPLSFLKGFEGYLHTDAYAGYRKLEEFGVILVECFAHVRRKFDEALKSLKKSDRSTSDANIGLDFCNKLFALERKYDAQNLDPESRAKQRELESRPVAEAFFAWAESCLPKTAPGTKLYLAISYALNQRHWLMNFLLDGRLEISNNRAERAIRPFAVGRNNWLFSYCEKGAFASAVLYSIIETALANGLVPFLYLKFLLEMLPNISREQLHECLPWNPTVQEICKIPSRED